MVASKNSSPEIIKQTFFCTDSTDELRSISLNIKNNFLQGCQKTWKTWNLTIQAKKMDF